VVKVVTSTQSAQRFLLFEKFCYVPCNDCTSATAREHVIDELVHLEDGVADRDLRGHSVKDNPTVAEVENAGRGQMSVSAEKFDGEVEVSDAHARPPLRKAARSKIFRWVAMDKLAQLPSNTTAREGEALSHFRLPFSASGTGSGSLASF